MAKLHEILAVESDLEATFKKMVKEAQNTFTKKAHLFQGSHKKLEMFDEDDKQKMAIPDELKQLDDTVPSKLLYLSAYAVNYLDLLLQKESTNQKAMANIEIDGKVLVADAPVTWLLGLEKRLILLRNVYESVPTLPPGTTWVPDADRGRHVYKSANPTISYRTASVPRSKVLYEATEHHPAQVEKWTESVNVGKYTIEHWSGMISPGIKSEMIGRIDKLLRAVKQARQRANTIDVETKQMSHRLIDFINGGFWD